MAWNIGYRDPSVIPLTFNQFQSFTDINVWPRDNLDYNTGYNRLLYDPTTGDVLALLYNTANNKIAMNTTWDNGATWRQIATDASNPSGSQPNMILGADMDSNGNIHMLSYSSTTKNPFVTKLSLTRTSGHISGFSIAQSAVALPTHSPDGATDAKGDLQIWKNGGTDTVVVMHSLAQTAGPNTDMRGYMAKAATSWTSNTDFVGIDGSGSDTNVYTSTGNVNLGNHLNHMQIVQEETSEHGFLLRGPFNSDYDVGVSASSDWDIAIQKLTKSTGIWTPSGTWTTIASVPGGGGSKPYLLSTCSAAGTAYVLIQDQANNLTVCAVDSSMNVNKKIMPVLALSGGAAFGAISADNNGNIWVIARGYNTTNVVSGLMAYGQPGGHWHIQTESSPQGSMGMSVCRNFPMGVLAMNDRGSTLSQTTDARELASAVGR